jgi:hypothetical protein
MSSKWRRFEVLLPLQFNDGNPVPEDWLGEALFELADRFGGASFETQEVKGIWLHAGVIYRDNSVRQVVDVPDLARNRKWMRQFKRGGKLAWDSWNYGW